MADLGPVAPDRPAATLPPSRRAWQAGTVHDGLELITLDSAAATLGVAVKRIHQLLSDGELIAIRDAGGERCIPARLLCDGGVVKALPAVITLLRDARFADGEIIGWLFRADDSLPGTPIDALREDRGREVKRRAQVAGF